VSDLSRKRRLREIGQFVVQSVKVYQNGTVQVVRSGEYRGGASGNKRGEVKEFSRSSRERLAIVSRETIHQFHSLLTLSYGKQFPINGGEVKLHLNRFMAWYRRRIGGEYIWWLEFQQRGAPHMHIASQKRKVAWYDREEFADKWAKAQGLTYGLYYSCLASKEERNLYDDVFLVHSHKRQWEPARKSDGPKRYIVKYALKMRQKIVPKDYRNVGRFWGCSRGVSSGVPEPRTVRITEDELRKKLHSANHIAKDWECIPRNLWGIGQEFDK
jgi:hypothetical protein